MESLKVNMSRSELCDILYGENATVDSLLEEYAIGGELLAEARDNHNMITDFFKSGSDGEYIEVDNDGYIIDEFFFFS